MSDIYRLITLNPETRTEKNVSHDMEITQLLRHVDKLAAGEEHVEKFHIIKVPETGAPSVALCESLEDLQKAVAEYTSGESGEIFIFKGMRITIGKMQHAVPLQIGDKEILVTANLQDKKEEEKPAEEPPKE